MCPINRDCDRYAEAMHGSLCSLSVRSVKKDLTPRLIYCCNGCQNVSIANPKPLPSINLDLTKTPSKLYDSDESTECIINDVNKIPKNTPFKQSISKMQEFQSLCEQLDSTCLCEFRPLVTKLYPSIPEHDKKILNCMIMKQMDDTVRMEYAYIAQKHWEEERNRRDAIAKQQQLEATNAIKEKRKVDKAIRDQRNENLNRQQQWHTNAIRQEIQAKKSRFNRRLEQLQYERKVVFGQRQRDRMRKHELTTRALQRNQLDDEIRNRECNAQLEQRITRADVIRNYYLDTYRRRINEANEKHKILHAANYEEIRKLKQMNLKRLKQRLAERDQKCDQFVENKMQWVEESRDRAHVTATLREIVRRSTSPDNYTHRNSVYKYIKMDRETLC